MQSSVIFKTLDNILSPVHNESYVIVQQKGAVGSRAVLNTAEAYALYAARVLEIEETPDQILNLIGENMREYYCYTTIFTVPHTQKKE